MVTKIKVNPKEDSEGRQDGEVDHKGGVANKYEMHPEVFEAPQKKRRKHKKSKQKTCANDSCWCAFGRFPVFIFIFCILRIIIRAPFVIFPCCACSKRQLLLLRADWILIIMCFNGIDRWSAWVVLGFGIENLVIKKEITDTIVPRPGLKRHKRQKNHDLSAVFHEDFMCGEGDYDNWKSPCALSIANKLIRCLNTIYPLTSADGPKFTRVDFEHFIETAFKDFCPFIVPRCHFKDPCSEMGVIKWCTTTLAGRYLMKSDNGYVCDLQFLERLEIRPGFSSAGGQVFISEDLKSVQKVTFKGKEFKPGDDGWEGALYVFRSSCFGYSILGVHTLHCHFMWGGFVTTCIREMEPDHPFRRFLSPFTVYTMEVNIAAKWIITWKNSVLMRNSSFTWQGLSDAFFYSANEWRVDSFEKLLEALGTDELAKDRESYPYGYFGTKLSKCMQKFAWQYVDHYWPTDEKVREDNGLQFFFREYSALMPLVCRQNCPDVPTTREALVEFMSSFIFAVTAMHEVSGYGNDILGNWAVGHTTASGDNDVYDPNGMRPNKASHLSVLFIAGLTNRPAASLYQENTKNITKYWLDDVDCGICQTFMDDLLEISKEHEAHNEGKDSWEFWSFDPKKLEISVTV